MAANRQIPVPASETPATRSCLQGLLIIAQNGAIVSGRRVEKISSGSLRNPILDAAPGTAIESQIPNPAFQLPTPNSQLPTPNSQLPTPNSSSLTQPARAARAPHRGP